MKDNFTNPARVSISLRNSNGFIVKFLISMAFLFPAMAFSQIWEPEGLNMPGAWNSWTNPPVNNLALASSTQVANGRVIKITDGIVRWQTIFSVASSGADLVGGTYDWLFTSGPEATPFQNKWASVVVSMNTLQSYTFQGASDNNITLVDNNWYTVVWEDAGYNNSRAIFMQTSAEPVEINSVSTPAGSVVPNQAVQITVTTNLPKSPEEIIYIHYTATNWNTSSVLAATMSGNSGTVTIPGQNEGVTVQYYAMSSTVAGISADYDLYTIRLNNNGGLNYSYIVEGIFIPEIGFANLQWPGSGSIQPGAEFNVYGQAWIDGLSGGSSVVPGLQAWIGYSTSNTNPNTWSNWLTASYLGPAGNNDEFIANLGQSLTTEGVYYYAYRFKYLDQNYVYGGYSASGGGFWDGTVNVSGELTVSTTVPDPEITYANLHWPPTASIPIAGSVDVYAQVEATGVNLTGSGYEGLTVWIGYSDQNTNPDTWTNWNSTTYNGISGFTNKPEYLGQLGSGITQGGTYYYASRFQLAGQSYIYGGYSVDGGGFWNGTDNISGVLTVEGTPPDPVIGWANLQWPPSGTIEPGQEYIVFSQAWIENVTGQPNPAPGLQAWVGYNTENTNPDTWTNWIEATYNAPASNNDEFVADLGAAIDVEDTYFYASRFQLDDQDYVYGGFSDGGGGFWNGVNYVSGYLVVVNEIVYYPVTFTVTESTGLWNNIKFKGEMTNWEAVDMEQNGNIWTVTLDILPGIYEWGLIEDDGTPEGIWLIVGENLEVMIDAEGNITGDTTYIITYTSVEELLNAIVIYPNPATDELVISFPNKNSYALLRLFEPSGKLIMQKTFDEGLHRVNISNLVPGVYILKMKVEGKTIVKKIVKQF
ncbi:MAG: T9SS type A sorting domain-containing protein [Bacteroidales bacterium]|nr:T9SS type A sorting domain-containing protein [Bacteroidales bacterium]